MFGKFIGVYIQGIFPIGGGNVKGLIPEVCSGVCTWEYVQTVCQRDCPKYVQGNMTRFFVQAHMSKEVVQGGMTKRVCSGESLVAYIQVIFPIGSGYVKGVIPEVCLGMHKGVCSCSMSKRLSEVSSRKFDYVLCSSS